MHKRCWFAIFILIFSYSALAQSGKAPATGKVETITSGPDGASAALRQALEEKGQRVLLDDGSVACEIWLRKNVPVQAKKEIPDALYGQLAESTLLGVISLSQASTDYRGQAIAAGAYSLRYELIPDDGNHLGVAPNRDFLLLIPVKDDPNPDAVFKFQELVEMSRKATGTRHPGPMNLVQAEGGAAPAVVKDDEDHWVFSSAVKLAPGGELPIALVVKGTAPQ